MAKSEADSFAVSIAPADHWNLVDCIAVVSASHKKTGSTEGHALAGTSPLQQARVEDADRRLKICRDSIMKKDLSKEHNLRSIRNAEMCGVMKAAQAM
jgi:diphosphomevalonate decarboxylase